MFEARIRHSVNFRTCELTCEWNKKIYPKSHKKFNHQTQHLLVFYFCLYRWSNVPKFYFPFVGRRSTQTAVSKNLCWKWVCLCKSGFIFAGDNKPSQTNMYRTLLRQTGHLAISLCRCLFILQIPWCLLKSWCSEDERDQVTQWKPHNDYPGLFLWSLSCIYT